jgi:UDP-N-acetylglucosamine--N-acetylmuramyl-(pentapeptide) pyrophosphoryl-undecaprenol N-acetylglucosamine transferase
MSMNTQSSDKTLMVLAGGTGGHIFPGLAVADYLRGEGWKISWLGNPTGMENQIVPSRGIPFEGINFGGLRGKGLKTKIMLPFNLMRALIQSASILKRVNPSVVLGMGGYVSFPAGLAAVLMGYPLVLHEQNSVAGLTNRILAKLAGRRLCAFPDALPDAEWVGNPLRADLLKLDEPKARFANRTGNLNILVVGGSLGAMALNTVVPEALSLIPKDKRPNVFHQSGEKHLADLKERYHALGVEAEVVSFIDNMASAYTKADVVICRAGAMTIAELSAGGVASCLVPFPYAVDDHQTSNARFLQQAGAAKLMPQDDMTPTRLAQWIESLNRDQLTEMAQRALQCAKPMATARVAAVCKELVTS